MAFVIFNLLCVAALIGADQAIKAWAVSVLQPVGAMPLIPHVRNTKGPRVAISDRMLRKIVSTLCKAAAKACEDPHIAAELERTSPHWFRHTSATHRQEAGARLETTQEELGHVNPKTTLRYAKIAARARREDAERFASAAVTYRHEEKRNESTE